LSPNTPSVSDRDFPISGIPGMARKETGSVEAETGSLRRHCAPSRHFSRVLRVAGRDGPNAWQRWVSRCDTGEGKPVSRQSGSPDLRARSSWR
jgi:hypothetical protein